MDDQEGKETEKTKSPQRVLNPGGPTDVHDPQAQAWTTQSYSRAFCPTEETSTVPRGPPHLLTADVHPVGHKALLDCGPCRTGLLKWCRSVEADVPQRGCEVFG